MEKVSLSPNPYPFKNFVYFVGTSQTIVRFTEKTFREKRVSTNPYPFKNFGYFFFEGDEDKQNKLYILFQSMTG